MSNYTSIIIDKSSNELDLGKYFLTDVGCDCCSNCELVTKEQLRKTINECILHLQLMRDEL